MGPTHVFRTAFARGLVIATAALIVLVAIYALIDAGLDGLTQALPYLIIGGGLVWALFGNPHVEVSDGGITVVNIARRVHVPWPSLRSVQAAWSLELVTNAGKYTSWAIPAASGTSKGLQNMRGRRIAAGAQSAAPQSAHSADAVAMTIADRRDALARAGYLGQPTHQEVRPEVTWNTRELVVLALVAATVAFLILQP